MLINRIANLIRYGNAYENDTLPYGFTEDDAAFLTRFAADTLA